MKGGDRYCKCDLFTEEPIVAELISTAPNVFLGPCHSSNGLTWEMLCGPKHLMFEKLGPSFLLLDRVISFTGFFLESFSGD